MISLEKTASWELLSWIMPNIQSFFLLWHLYINPRKKKENNVRNWKCGKLCRSSQLYQMLTGINHRSALLLWPLQQWWGWGRGGRVQAGFEWLVIDCPSLFPIIHAWRVTLHCIENFYINFICSPILPFFTTCTLICISWITINK